MSILKAGLSCLGLAAALIAPAATYYVSPNGDDSASGAASHPFRSIQHAADIARAGDTVEIDDGVYAETVLLRNSGAEGNPIRFWAVHPGMVSVTGADPIFDWTRLPGRLPIYYAPWDHLFAISWSNGKPVEHHPEDAVLWGRAEQVIADGRQLLPTLGLDGLTKAWNEHGDRSILTPPLRGLGGPFGGSFAVDTAAKRLYVWLTDGSDPNKHKMLASTRDQTFGVNPWQKADGVSYVQVKGIHFIYGASFPQRPVVSLFGGHNVVEDCFVEQMSGAGVGVNGVLRNCVISGCGHIGGSANGDGFVNENDAWIGNSWKPIDRGWEAGGVKQGATKNGLFNHCLFRRNGGPGLWLDVWVHDVRITNCVFQENEGCGLFVEISHHIKADHNLAIRNALSTIGSPAGWSDGGMVIAESEDCEFTYNTCVGNRFGIGFREQGPRDNDTDTGHIAFHDARDTVTHNLLVDNQMFQLGMWFDNPFFGRHPSDSAKYPTEAAFDEYVSTIPDKVFDPTKQHLIIDFNSYSSGTVAEKDDLYGVPWRPRSREFAHVSEFARVTGFDQHALALAPKTDPLNPAATKGSGWADAPSDITGWIKRGLAPWLSSKL
jgi:hypothetical protein